MDTEVSRESHEGRKKSQNIDESQLSKRGWKVITLKTQILPVIRKYNRPQALMTGNKSPAVEQARGSSVL